MPDRRKDVEVHTTPIRLALIGGSLILFSGILAVLGIPTGVSFLEGHLMIVKLQGISIYHGVAETVIGLLMILYTLYINSGRRENIQNWSIVVLILSLLSLIGGGGFFMGFVMSIIAGILGIVRTYAGTESRTVYVRRVSSANQKPITERVKLQNKIIRTLKPEEGKIYNIINDAEGAIFQAELVEKSGYSKVKVSRILDRLEGRGIVERKRRGMTNIVIARYDQNI